MASRRKMRGSDTLFTPTTATHGAIQDPRPIGNAGSHIAIQLATTGTSAVVELYGRIHNGAPWALFETVTVDAAGFIRAYFGIQDVAGKVTTITGGGTVSGWVFFDD